MTRGRDSILSHCIARAMIVEWGGVEAAKKKYGENAERLPTWTKYKTATKVTPLAARVGGFIVTWAVAMREEGRDEYSITEYQRYWNEGERQAYRLQREFRELWPEFETPTELARQIVKYVDAKALRKNIGTLPAQLQVAV